MGLLLFIDTETCGIPNDRLPDDHPAQPPLVQLGAVLIDEDNGAEWGALDVVVRPNGYSIPPEATRCHGITTAAAVLVGIPLSAVVPMYVHFRSRARAIVAFNKAFDLTIMRQAIARNGKPVTLLGPESVECVMEMTTPLINIPPTESMKRWGYGGKPKTPSLVEAYRWAFGEDYVGAHSAIADARATVRLYFELKKRAADSADSAATATANETPLEAIERAIDENNAPREEAPEPALVTEARRDGAV